ncbi:MBL fold metallo-hydrolase [Undibacterium terreum]|uniref:Hydrolase n=1 Tax=Undibacterium terreum TaxID=1224302 RepID=A0A916UKP4_9BURK|nr:MBL fold metallo-hydrolase [Undibacterium terreum]GGC75216.1 hydrolase [Undibacterium terreum]
MATGSFSTRNNLYYPPASQQEDGKFRNAAPRHKLGFVKSLRLILRFMFDKPANTVPAKPIPVQALTREQLAAAPDRSLFRLGHSTMLLKLRGEFWLTDPVFSERASPLQWMGPKRFHQPPITIADLPDIKGVILSHDHYDHLDHAAILQLNYKVEHFLTPLGVGDTLIKWGIPAAKVRQLDWWQSATVDGLQLVATPSQHFSGRGLFDGNSTLWASWVIMDGNLRVFFSGDTGYFNGFKTIGNKYGPFDITLIETGAYGADWPDIHMQPEQTLQAHIDLRGKTLVPIHNGTFDLAMHPWHEPFDRIVDLAQQKGVTLSTPQMGEQLDLAQPQAGRHWWQDAE